MFGDSYVAWGYWSGKSIYKGLSASKVLPWTIELIEKFKDYWNWSKLSANQYLPWSLTLIEKCLKSKGPIYFIDEYYDESWRWDVLAFNPSFIACLPKLSFEDIDEVMSYHFPLTQISKQSNDFDDDLPF